MQGSAGQGNKAPFHLTWGSRALLCSLWPTSGSSSERDPREPRRSSPPKERLDSLVLAGLVSRDEHG